MAIDTLGANALARNSVTSVKIADDAVTSAKVAAGAVAVGDIADGSITTAKLADDAVTSAKLGASAVVTASIADNAITTAKITDSNITAAKIAAGAGGKVLQVVHQNADTSGNLVETTSTSFTNAFTATITPTVATSKMHIFCSFGVRDTRDGDQLAAGARIVRQISGGSDVEISSAKTAYSNTEYLVMHLRYISHPAAARLVTEHTFVLEDDHNTTNAITYKLQMKASVEVGMGGCYFTFMEIAT